MVDTKEIPEALKPYTFHGVKLEGIGKKELTADCPFCGSEGKFNVNAESTLFRCWAGSCGENGNPTTFLRKYLDLCTSETNDADYKLLAKESGFNSLEGMKNFGVALSPLTNKWVVPGFNHQGAITGMYKWTKIQNKDKTKWINKLLPTPTLGHHLFNAHNFDPNLGIVDIAEGWRDGIAWYDAVQQCEDVPARNIVAVPGTNSFKTSWVNMFEGMVVNILFDNDYPGVNKVTNEVKESAGVFGVKYLTSMLRASAKPPAEINYIAWGGESRGYTESLPDGHDLRDFLKVS